MDNSEQSTRTTTVVISSKERDLHIYPTPLKYRLALPTILRRVVGVELLGVVYDESQESPLLLRIHEFDNEICSNVEKVRSALMLVGTPDVGRLDAPVTLKSTINTLDRLTVGWDSLGDHELVSMPEHMLVLRVSCLVDTLT